MLPLIIFSIIFGFAVNMTKSESNKISNTLDSISKVMMNVIKIVMYYAPVGIFAYFASLVSKSSTAFTNAAKSGVLKERTDVAR